MICKGKTMGWGDGMEKLILFILNLLPPLSSPPPYSPPICRGSTLSKQVYADVKWGDVLSGGRVVI